MSPRRFPQEIALGIEALAGVGHLLFLFAIISHLRGQEFVGEYIVIATWSAVFAIIGDAGMPVLMMREMGKRPESRHRLMAAGLAICLVTSTLSAGLMVLVTGWLAYDQRLDLAFALAAAVLIPRTVSMLARAPYIASARAERYVCVKLFEYLLITAVGSFLIIEGRGLGALFLTILLATCATATVLIIDVKRSLVRESWSFSRDSARELIGPALSFAMIDASVMLFWRADILMLSKLATVAMAGLYAAATRFLAIFAMLPAIFAQTHLPRIARAIKTKSLDQTDLENRVRLLFLLVTPAAGGIFIFAEPSLRLLFGASFIEAKPALQVHMITLLLLTVDMVLSTIYEAAGYQRNQMFIATGGLAVNIALNVLLIPLYGYMGAAVATLISVSGSCVLHLWLVARQVIRLNWLRILAAPFALTTLAVGPAVVLMGNVHVLLLSLFSALVYSGLVFMFRRQLAPFLRY